MGCSIKENAKVWKIRRFTDDFVCDMIFMLGGFHEEAALFRYQLLATNVRLTGNDESLEVTDEMKRFLEYHADVVFVK